MTMMAKDITWWNLSNNVLNLVISYKYAILFYVFIAVAIMVYAVLSYSGDFEVSPSRMRVSEADWQEKLIDGILDVCSENESWTHGGSVIRTY